MRQFDKKVVVNGMNGLKSYYTLNPLEIIKDLQRIIRLLQFSQQQEQFLLKLNFSNSHYNKELFSLIMNRKNKVLPKKIAFENNYIFDLKKNEGACMLIDSFQNKRFYERVFDDNKHLILEFNSKIIKNNYGTYRLFLNSNDWKKIIFLSLLVRNIYKSN
jgi:hypothetical protein